eukprot:12111173-Prorocentrum_lima.AAC.1
MLLLPAPGDHSTRPSAIGRSVVEAVRHAAHSLHARVGHPAVRRASTVSVAATRGRKAAAHAA